MARLSASFTRTLMFSTDSIDSYQKVWLKESLILVSVVVGGAVLAS